MSTFKNVSGNYTITCANGTGTLFINGNVDVTGNVTYIDATELVIQDPFIVLNSSNTGVYLANSGVLTHTANTTYAGIRYNRTAVQWELSGATDATGLSGSWTPIATGNIGVGGANTEIQFNNAGVFGGNANLTYDFATSKLTLAGHQVLGNIGSTPAATANSVTIYNNAEGSGGTGLYVKSTTVDSEVVSLVKARLFAIIF